MNEPLSHDDMTDAQNYLMQMNCRRGWSEPETKKVSLHLWELLHAVTAPLSATRCSSHWTAAAPWCVRSRCGKNFVNTNVVCRYKGAFLPSFEEALTCTSCWCSVPVSSLLLLICVCHCPWEERDLVFDLCRSIVSYVTQGNSLIWTGGEYNMAEAVKRCRMKRHMGRNKRGGPYIRNIGKNFRIYRDNSKWGKT